MFNGLHKQTLKKIISYSSKGIMSLNYQMYFLGQIKISILPNQNKIMITKTKLLISGSHLETIKTIIEINHLLTITLIQFKHQSEVQ